jgi:hypothetical protein
MRPQPVSLTDKFECGSPSAEALKAACVRELRTQAVQTALMLLVRASAEDCEVPTNASPRQDLASFDKRPKVGTASACVRLP